MEQGREKKLRKLKNDIDVGDGWTIRYDRFWLAWRLLLDGRYHDTGGSGLFVSPESAKSHILHRYPERLAEMQADMAEEMLRHELTKRPHECVPKNPKWQGFDGSVYQCGRWTIWKIGWRWMIGYRISPIDPDGSFDVEPYDCRRALTAAKARAEELMED